MDREKNKCERCDGTGEVHISLDEHPFEVCSTCFGTGVREPLPREIDRGEDFQCEWCGVPNDDTVVIGKRDAAFLEWVKGHRKGWIRQFAQNFPEHFRSQSIKQGDK